MRSVRRMLLGTYGIGIVHYREYPTLARCLVSIRAQTVAPVSVLVIDVEPDAALREPVASVHREVVFRDAPNRGYAGGANAAIAELGSGEPSPEFVLLMNPDVELEPDFAQTMLEATSDAPRVALAGGKLLRPDGSLDSAGIDLPRSRRPHDRGSGDRDRGQYDRSELVFGATGAALWMRRSAVLELALDGEIFDEDFFLYYEDTDLAWRAARLGWDVLYEPRARATHVRRWQREQRFEIEPWVRRHSFKNHYLQIVKNERTGDLLLNLPILLGWEILRLSYALLRDPAVLPAYIDALRLFPRALHKRRLLAELVRRGAASLED